MPLPDDVLGKFMERIKDVDLFVRMYYRKKAISLVALGPSAGVLVYDLYCAGFQAVDIGHMDLEYEWYLSSTGERCEVKTKYNNEFHGGDQVEDIEDSEYLAQIIEKIC